jgi:hypothetical protein
MSALSILAAAAAAQAAAQTGTPTATPSASAPTAVSGTERKPGESDYIDLEGGLGYSTNPLLQTGSDLGRGFGRISLHAVHARVSERSTTLISAYAQNVSYFGRYGSQQSFEADARHDTAINEHTRIFVDASGSFDKGGQLDTQIIGLPLVPPLPGAPGTPPVLLPIGSDFLSITGRTWRIAAHGGATFALSPRDDLSVTGGAEHVAFRGAEDTDYTTIPISLSYDRQISPRSTIGARVTFADTNYNGPADTRVVTPQVTTRVRLSERVTFDGAVGISFARVNDGVRTTNSTGFAGEGDLCLNGEESNLCARAAANEETPTVAGPARSVDASIDYSRRLSADSSFDLSAGISHFSAPISVITGRTFSSSTYYRAAADYSRRISGRWFGGVNLAARKLAENGPDPKADLSASLFIRYRFGDVR